MWRIMLAGSLLTLASWMVGILPAQAQAQAQTGSVTCEQDYTLARGDWLSKIANKFYGDPKAYLALVSATNTKSETDFSYATIVNPDAVEVGWKLCVPAAADAKVLNGTDAPAGLARTALQNAAYKSEMSSTGVAQLKSGKFSENIAGTPLRQTVTFIEPVAYGTLNGTSTAGVLTADFGGGTGTFYVLHLMQEQNGKLTEIATQNLGDRSPIIALAIENEQIRVDQITQGPDQPMCCGTLRVVTIYKRDGDKLTQVSRQELGNLGPNGETPGSLPTTTTPAASPTPTTGTPEATVTPTASATPGAESGAAALQGAVWKWQGSEYADGSKLTPEKPENYTLEFTADGRVNVKFDCNSGGGAYTVQGQTLKFGALISTLIGCPAGSLGSEFGRDLQAVTAFQLDGDQLVLTLPNGTMRFAK